MGLADESDLKGRTEPDSEVPYWGDSRLRRLGTEQERE